MKFVPRHSQAIGRVVVKRILSTIIRPDETKNTTKFVLIDGVGPDAAAAGIKVGDIVLVEAGVSCSTRLTTSGARRFHPSRCGSARRPGYCIGASAPRWRRQRAWPQPRRRTLNVFRRLRARARSRVVLKHGATGGDCRRDLT